MAEKLFPDHFLKSPNSAQIYINSLKFYTVCFYIMLSYGLLKCIEARPQPTCFLSQSFSLKKGLELVTSLLALFSA